MNPPGYHVTSAEWLGAANERQSAGDSAAALAAYELALPLLPRDKHPQERARVLFQMAQLARLEGQVERAFASYDELLPLAAELADHRAHGLAVAMRGQLVFMQGDKSAGIQAMVSGLEELRGCGAGESEHLTCHTRFLSRRLPRAEFERCVHAATADEALRDVLLRAGGC